MPDSDPIDVQTPTSLRHEYRRLVLAEAHRQGLTADQVRELGYHAIGAICGVDTSEGHEPSPEFFYQLVRLSVAKTLEREVEAAIAEDQRVKFRASVRLRAGYDNAEVRSLGNGLFEIIRDPSTISFEVVG